MVWALGSMGLMGLGAWLLYRHWRWGPVLTSRPLGWVASVPALWGLILLGAVLGEMAQGGEAGLAKALTGFMVLMLMVVVYHAQFGLPPKPPFKKPGRVRVSLPQRPAALALTLAWPRPRTVRILVAVILLAPLLALWAGCLLHGLGGLSDMDRYVLMMGSSVVFLSALWVVILRA